MKKSKMKKVLMARALRKVVRAERRRRKMPWLERALGAVAIGKLVQAKKKQNGKPSKKKNEKSRTKLAAAALPTIRRRLLKALVIRKLVKAVVPVIMLALAVPFFLVKMPHGIKRLWAKR